MRMAVVPRVEIPSVLVEQLNISITAVPNLPVLLVVAEQDLVVVAERMMET